MLGWNVQCKTYPMLYAVRRVDIDITPSVGISTFEGLFSAKYGSANNAAAAVVGHAMAADTCCCLWPALVHPRTDLSLTGHLLRLTSRILNAD